MNEEQLEDFENRLTARADGGKASEQMISASGQWSRDAELSQFKQASG